MFSHLANKGLDVVCQGCFSILTYDEPQCCFPLNTKRIIHLPDSYSHVWLVKTLQRCSCFTRKCKVLSRALIVTDDSRVDTVVPLHAKHLTKAPEKVVRSSSIFIALANTYTWNFKEAV